MEEISAGWQVKVLVDGSCPNGVEEPDCLAVGEDVEKSGAEIPHGCGPVPETKESPYTSLYCPFNTCARAFIAGMTCSIKALALLSLEDLQSSGIRFSMLWMADFMFFFAGAAVALVSETVGFDEVPVGGAPELDNPFIASSLALDSDQLPGLPVDRFDHTLNRNR